VTPGVQVVRFADSMAPASRAKPPYAAGLQIFRGTAPPGVVVSDPNACRFVVLATRNPVTLEYGEEDNGLQATLYGRWANAKGEVGPWSNPASMIISGRGAGEGEGEIARASARVQKRDESAKEA